MHDTKSVYYCPEEDCSMVVETVGKSSVIIILAGVTRANIEFAKSVCPR